MIMDELIFVFRSRTQATRFYDKLKSLTNCKLVNTPLAVSSSCGLSVRVSRENGYLAYAQLDRYDYTTFMGAYSYDSTNNVYQRITGR